MSEIDTPVRLEEEEAAVDRWRCNCYKRMGFDNDEITLLLFAEVNLGDVRNLLLAGATYDQVVRILC